MIKPIKPFSYSDKCRTPEGYSCSECGTTGVRLYRQYQTFTSKIALKCRACAIKENGKEPKEPIEHSIGWLVAAVPTEDGETYWGYSSVPQLGVDWWNNLPKINQEKSKTIV